MDLLSLFFPKFCVGCNKLGSYLCDECFSKVELYKTPFCSECGRAAVHGLTHPTCLKRDSLYGVVCFFQYEDPLKKLIHRIKYRFSSDLVEVVEKLLGKTKFPVVLKGYDLIPLPLNKARENWRGFNQAEIIAKKLAKEYGLTLISEKLVRRSFAKPQAGLLLEERKRNLKNAFEATDSFEGRNVIVFDDVWTSGTTLKEAGKTLKKAGANKVWALALASPHRVR